MILALELATRRNWKGGNASTPEFVTLSALLRAANLHGLSNIPANFRTPSSVAMKVSNFIGANVEADGGLRKTQAETDLVEEFRDDQPSLKAAADGIRQTIRDRLGL